MPDASASLKLHRVETCDEPPRMLAPDQAAQLCAAFSAATGWRLSLGGPGQGVDFADWTQPIAREGRDVGRIALRRPEPRSGRASSGKAAEHGRELEDVRPLARAIAGLLGEICELRDALWKREAELAAGVPVTARPDEPQHLAERLQSVLKAGAEAVGCSAAGLYLLDEGTTSLKLRAMHGLPKARLLDEPRPLRGAVADLEALVGHAVALEDTSLLPHWKCPEPFPAACCVPVSSTSTPLGTLWVFADDCRDFSPEQTNLLEIIAGRLAADLEREMLLAASTTQRKAELTLAPAVNWQRDRLPAIQPLIENLEVAGWTAHAGPLGGDFHDWWVQTDGRLVLAAGSANGGELAAALGAAALHGALKGHAAARPEPAMLLRQLNETLWAASPGDQHAGLAYALLDPEAGSVQLALAGGTCAVVVGPERRRMILAKAPPLGQEPELRVRCVNLTLKPQESLFLLTQGVLQSLDPLGLRIGEAALAAFLKSKHREAIGPMAASLREWLARGQPIAAGRALVAAKHRGARRTRPR